MFKNNIEINKKDYLACNKYYLKKFIGIKEYLLLLFLLIAGLVLGLMLEKMFILIMCGITFALVILAVLFFFGTSHVGYNAEFKKRGAVRWEVEFSENEIKIDLFEREGQEKYTEIRGYEKIDKVAFLKDRVYVYFNVAVMLYLRHESFTEGNMLDFIEFLKGKLKPEQLKMKTKRKRF